MLGERLGSRNRLTPIVKADPSVNNGSITGGLAYALQKYLEGRSYRNDMDQEDAATQALLRGLTGRGVNPEAGTMGPIQPQPGGYDQAATELAGLGGNPYAGRLANQLLLRQAEAKQAASLREAERAAENQQWEHRFGLQTQAQNDLLNRRQAFDAEQAGLDRASRKSVAQIRGSDTPSSVQEWAFFNSLGPDDQQRFLALKRNPQFLNLGDQFLRPDALNPGQTIDSRAVGLGPDRKITDDRIITTPGIAGGQTGQLAPEGHQPGQPILQALPPTPEEARKTMENQRLKGEKFNTVDSRFQQILDTMEGAYLPTTGFIGGQMLSGFGGTAAHDIAADLETIRGIIGFGELQAMREASPTGGALGQVSEMENLLLQAQYGSLAQSQGKEQFLRNLQTVRDTFYRIVHEGIGEQEAAAMLDQIRASGSAPVQSQRQPAQQGGAPAQSPSNNGWSIQRID